MKTYNFINSANESIKTVGANLRSGNKEYTSLSRVLKDTQRAELLKAGYREVYEALGLNVDGKTKVTPAEFLAALAPEQWGQTYNKAGEKVGEKWVGIWGWAQKKDSEGNKVFETVNGAEVPVMEPKLRKVTAWTPNKLFKVYAQALALRAEQASK